MACGLSAMLGVPEVFAPFRAFVVEFIRQIGDKVFEVRQLQRTPHLLICVGVKWVEVHAEGAREQHRVLGERTADVFHH